MEEYTDCLITRRLKATLANFHSYCQKRSSQHSQIKQRSQSNKSITKYCSTRQLKRLQENKLKSGLSSAKKKEAYGAESGLLQMKSSDLIEIIKLKLNSQSQQELRMKTEGNENKIEMKNSRFVKKITCYDSNHYNKSLYMNDRIKRKKINLIIENSKRSAFQQPQPKQQRIESLNITLPSRPYSAITKPQFFNHKPSSETESSFNQKYSCQLIRRPQNKSSTCYKSDQPKKKQALSGWDLPLDDDFLSIEHINHVSQERKKKMNS